MDCVRRTTISTSHHLRMWQNLDHPKLKGTFLIHILISFILLDCQKSFLTFASLIGLFVCLEGCSKFPFRIKIHFFFFTSPNLEELFKQRTTFEVKRNCAIKPEYEIKSERGP